MRTLLGVFAKHWTPGRVKTRLAAAIGSERAAEIHRLFTETLLNRFRAVADVRFLVFDPPESETEFRRAAGEMWQLLPQGAGDLGERMAKFFAAGLARAERVVLIGSDSPDLPESYIADALDALATTDVVLGPAIDGGYYLVGARGRVPPIFDDIAWSTPDVWTQTVARLKQAGCRWHELPRWYDVDASDELERLVSNLQRLQGADRHLAALADRLSDLLRPSLE